MMLTGVDHLVIVVPDLGVATKSYQDVGFTVVPGGRHEGIGTHNALIAFSDESYVELIAFYEPRPDHRWWAPLARGGGLVDYCLRTDDLAADAAAFRAAGVDLGDVEPKSRKRPDGFEVRWRFAVPRGGHRGVAPFVITDDTPREERVPRQQSHANQATGIATVTVAVANVSEVRRWYSMVVGEGSEPVERPDLKGSGVRFTVGPHVLEFVAPETSGTPLAEWLQARGPSPYAATLVTSAKAAAGELLADRTQGARLAFVQPRGR